VKPPGSRRLRAALARARPPSSRRLRPAPVREGHWQPPPARRPRVRGAPAAVAARHRLRASGLRRLRGHQAGRGSCGSGRRVLRLSSTRLSVGGALGSGLGWEGSETQGGKGILVANYFNRGEAQTLTEYA